MNIVGKRMKKKKTCSVMIVVQYLVELDSAPFGSKSMVQIHPLLNCDINGDHAEINKETVALFAESRPRKLGWPFQFQNQKTAIRSLYSSNPRIETPAAGAFVNKSRVRNLLTFLYAILKL